MHLRLQTMAYRNFVPDNYSAEINNMRWKTLTARCRTKLISPIFQAGRIERDTLTPSPSPEAGEDSE